MGQAGSKAGAEAAGTAARNLKYPGAAAPGSAASRITLTPNTTAQHPHQPPRPNPGPTPSAAAESQKPSFQSQFNAFKSQQQRSFDESTQTEEEPFDPSKPQDSLNGDSRSKLRALLDSSMRRESKFDRIQLNESFATSDISETPSQPSPADRIIREFRTDGSVIAREVPLAEPPLPEEKAVAAAQSVQTSADPKGVTSQFPLMDAQKKAMEEMNRKDEALAKNLSSLWGNLVTTSGAPKTPTITTTNPEQKYGYQRPANAPRRPLPQKNPLMTEEMMEKNRVPAGKLDHNMLLQLMVMSKLPRASWNLAGLSSKYKVDEKSIETLFAHLTLPWLLPEGETITAFKHRPDSSAAVLMGDSMLKENIKSKLGKPQTSVEEASMGSVI